MVSAFAVFGTLVNLAMYGLNSETVTMGVTFGGLLALAALSASGNTRGTSLLAIALLFGGLVLVGEGILSQTAPRWGSALLVLCLAAALAAHVRFFASRRTAAEQADAADEVRVG